MKCDLVDCYHDNDIKGQWAQASLVAAIPAVFSKVVYNVVAAVLSLHINC